MRRTRTLPSTPHAPGSRALCLTIAAPALLALGACAARQGPDAGALRRLQESTAPTSSRASYVIAGASVPGDRMLSDVVRERWPRLVQGDLPRGELDRFGAIDRFGVYDARGAFLGGPLYLESVRARDIVQLRRLTMIEEASRFGRGHPAGAVIITWRTGG